MLPNDPRLALSQANATMADRRHHAARERLIAPVRSSAQLDRRTTRKDPIMKSIRRTSSVVLVAALITFVALVPLAGRGVVAGGPGAAPNQQSIPAAPAGARRLMAN